MNIEDIKYELDSMGLPYKEEMAPANQTALINSFGYTALPIVVDLSGSDRVDAEMGVVVRNASLDSDDGVYIFTVLHSGQAGFIVVKPGTISKAPMVRRISGDVVSAISGMDMPPMMPFDAMEISMHVMLGTIMKNIIESCRIPKEYEDVFLHIYFPKFLTDMGLYYAGATTKDGQPMVYEEIVNMEPMVIWNAMQKGDGDEGRASGCGDGDRDGTERAEEKPGKEETEEG